MVVGCGQVRLSSNQFTVSPKLLLEPHYTLPQVGCIWTKKLRLNPDKTKMLMGRRRFDPAMGAQAFS